MVYSRITHYCFRDLIPKKNVNINDDIPVLFNSVDFNFLNKMFDTCFSNLIFSTLETFTHVITSSRYRGLRKNLYWGSG